MLCLQEVQVDHFESDIKPFLDSIGYSGHHDQKTRESMGQAGKVLTMHSLMYCGDFKSSQLFRSMDARSSIAAQK